MQILAVIAGLGSLACWIMTLVKLFSAGKTVEGICGICPLIGFILGWVRAKELDHTKVMMIWTVLVVISIVINVAFAASHAGSVR